MGVLIGHQFNCISTNVKIFGASNLLIGLCLWKENIIMDDILMLALRDGYFACQNAKGAQNLEKEISMLCDKYILS